MKTKPSPPKETEPGLESDSPCLVHAVAETMKEEPALEAVKFDRARQSISVATLGRADKEELEQNLAGRIKKVQERSGGSGCDLLEGKGDCQSCPLPLSDEDKSRITVEHQEDVTTISRVTCPTAPRFWRWHDMGWPKYVPRTVELPEDEKADNEWKRQLAASILCGVCALLAHFAFDAPLRHLFYGLSYLAGAWFTVEEVWERLEKRILDVHFLMLAVAIGSAVIGAYNEGATLLFLFSFSGALEHYAMGRTHREIRSLFKTAPKEAVLLDQLGRERLISVEALQPGMRLLVRPGQQFPVDAEIAKGQTASDESNLTGEATPVSKNVGDSVFAGTLNLWGVVEAAVRRPASQSALQKIIELIQEAQQRKAPSQRFTDQFGTRYTYVILGLSLLMFFVWWLGFHWPPFVTTASGPSAFYRTMTLLVVASPCALVLSIPSAVLAAIAWAARRGILFRGGAAVEKLGEVDVVAMDKTGTLTTGELKVETVESFPPGREEEVGRLAYSLERLSNHPLARAVTLHGKQRQWEPLELDQFESVTGLGLKAAYQGQPLWLGRREWLRGQPCSPLLEMIPPVEPGFSEVWLLHGDLVGRLLLRDDIRPQSREVVRRLREAGLKTLVLTGDRQATAAYLKEKLNLDEARSELKPEQKVEIIESLVREGKKPAMVGDGVNDAPSLAAAHVGVAMGARGSDAALEQAEVVLMHDRLENFDTAYRLSLRSCRVIRQNLVVSLGTVVVLVSCALLGIIPLTLGVVGHEGSTVVVVLNSLRLLLGKGSGSSSFPESPAKS
jgi:Zn2+/Cd2+-exporting ATPase